MGRTAGGAARRYGASAVGWQALARAEESYTVFVHLIDAANRPLVTFDYTPLEGSFAPTQPVDPEVAAGPIGTSILPAGPCRAICRRARIISKSALRDGRV